VSGQDKEIRTVRRFPVRLLLLFTLVVALPGCTGSTGSTGASPSSSNGPRTGPAGDAFYTPPPESRPAPGRLIWSRRFVLTSQVEGLNILYWSTSVTGKPVPVSGVVYRSTAPQAPGAAQPIVAWAHGTTGLGDSCAPSRTRPGGRSPYAGSGLIGQVLNAGMMLVATDYAGLGTPGEHPYVVGIAEGHDVLDSIRAAAQLGGATTRPQAIVMGESQGGGAALFAAELAPKYAPDIALRASIAVAPPSQLERLQTTLDGGKYVGYTLMTMAGFEAAYPELAAENKLLTPAGSSALGQIRTECGEAIISRFARTREAVYGVDKVLTTPAFRARLRENDPGQVGTTVPILVVHGEADDLIPVALSKRLVRDYCSHRTPVSAKFYPHVGHAAFSTAGPDIIAYIRDRVMAKPPPSACSSKG
jgi:pimeloyl-ACP methyl ester carboxylesterase